MRTLALIALIVMGGIANTMTATPQAQSMPSMTHTLSASTMAVAATPTVSATFIDKVLCNASSPACGTGNALYEEGVQYGIDPVYALAFFHHESSFGKYGIAATNKGLGNIRCSDGYRCLNGFRAYASWEAGYDDWYKLIRYYIDQWHKTTIDAIVPTYAPSSENDTAGYVASIKAAVTIWRKGEML
jgi:hypothetical protein